MESQYLKVTNKIYEFTIVFEKNAITKTDMVAIDRYIKKKFKERKSKRNPKVLQR